jgi:hypothetical protein
VVAQANELSSPDKTPGSSVRILPEAWLSVSVYSVCVVLRVRSALRGAGHVFEESCGL